MKFSTTSGLLSLGLLGSVSADWRDASAPDSKPVDTTSAAASNTWGAGVSPAVSTVTVTDTTTEYIERSTIFRTTVLVGGDVCGAKPTGVVPAGGNGPAGGSSPVSPAQGGSGSGSSSGSGSGSGGYGAGSGSGSGSGSDSGSDSGSGSGSGSGNGWGSGSGSDSAATTAAPGGGNGGHGPGSGPGGLNPNIPDGTVIGTNGEVYTWTGSAPDEASATHSWAIPTYAGWGDYNGGGGSGSNGTGPPPGSDASNVTKPFPPLGENGCNSAGDRSKWCGGFSVDTDTATSGPDTGKTCSYNWVITNTTLDLDGVPRLALAINGQVPGPAIECNWGDWIQVQVTNKMQDNATSIHWHGIIQKGTNDQDGVPGITECAIAPGDSRTYRFKANQYGTGWYHSHALTQLGDGVRGPMIIHGPATANYDIDSGTVMIDDLFGNGNQTVTAATQNSRIAHFGPGPTWNYVLNGHNTFPDLSRGKHALWTVKPGKKHLFRLINSASQNMWSVHFDNHKMTVISTDYVPIKPYTTEWLNIGIGQRYDVIVEMNQPTAGYFLRAVTQTGCPSGCVNTGLGQANGIFQYEGAPLTLPTSTAGNKTVADFAFCLDEPLAKLSPWVKKSAGTRDAFSSSASLLPAGAVANTTTTDDGVVFRWFLNNGAINVDYEQPTLSSIAAGSVSNGSISNPIFLQKKNEWYYFIIQNQFFASHPMHLHGHDMSVLGQGSVSWNPSLIDTLNFDNPARRDTALLIGSRGPGNPPGYTVIGFQSDNPGAWLMHCHIVWHVDGGLALQWVERPSDIPASTYVSKPSYQNECKALKAYHAAGGREHTSGESGLKARGGDYFDQMMGGMAAGPNVVRREGVEKRYIDQHVKRAHHF